MKTINFNDPDIQEFVIEARDILDLAEKSLLSYDQNKLDFLESYNQLFRAFHSIKGASAMLGMDDLKNHMHQVESILSSFKTVGHFKKNETIFFLKAIDCTLDYFQGSSINFDYDINATSEANKIIDSEVPTAKNVQDDFAADAPLVYAIDDEPDILDILKDIITQEKIRCVTFMNADELYAAVKKQSPNVVLTDMQMPNLTGLQVLSEVKKIDPDIPVVFISGYLTKEILIKGITEDGIFAAIEKPFDNDKTVSIVRKAAKQNQLTKLLDRTINVVMYQLPELCEFLKSMNKTDIETAIREEILSLIKLRRVLKAKK